jgi:2-polyprenyl-6-hydroxyphenyl methylase/3-demethylubiquinone-9 3-methyltransferase
VGCGEGAVTERLVRLYPDADILSIDVSPTVGRLFRGCAARVTFIQKTVQAVAAESPYAFDLVILSDVIHHVPLGLRRELLEAARRTLTPGGALIFKDWERSATPIHWLCHAGDRWLTGDRVKYLRRTDAFSLLAEAFDHAPISGEAFVSPWRNNFALLIRV